MAAIPLRRLRGPAVLIVCLLTFLVVLDGATYRLAPWWSPSMKESSSGGASPTRGSPGSAEAEAHTAATAAPRARDADRNPAPAGMTPDPAGAGASAAPAAPYPRPGPGLNLLALEASPYLQIHAENPVNWYPWDARAFVRARAEQKPIFLSVGYSTCYWCHVMERKVFSDPEIAALMNAHFVSVKVDREERPDIDELYMKATHLLTGSGGWPNSVFLTPDGRPFFAGTYFPPEDAYGRPGFPRVLRTLHEVWRTDRARVEKAASRVTEHITALADPAAARGAELPPVESLLARALRDLAGTYEPEHGGFSSRTKFPRPPTLELLLTHLEGSKGSEESKGSQASPGQTGAPQATQAPPGGDEGSPAPSSGGGSGPGGAEGGAAGGDGRPGYRRMLTHTLDEMALGGIYDHLAGGFHRYSTEPTWSIPHFEKMLYDNAQIVGVYARAYSLTGRPLYRRTAEETVAYLDREMSVPGGGFASAQDAQVDGEEGVSYVWSREEIEAVLGSENAEAFLDVYELAPMREHPSSGVLRVRLPVEPALERTGAPNVAALLARFADERARLLKARRQRPQPLRDAKVLAAWNGLAIRGLVEAGLALERPEWIQRAARAARFVLARLGTEEGGLRRSYVAGQARERGVLSDYAFLADGLLALHAATGEVRWLGEARKLADEMLARFEDPEGGGFYMSESDVPLLARPKPFEDNAQPSGSAVALRVLQDLAARTGEARYARAALGVAQAAAVLLQRAPSALASTVAALAEAGGVPHTAVAAADEARSTPAAASGSGSASASSSGSASGGSGSPSSGAAESSGSGAGDGFRLPRSEDHVELALVPEEGGAGGLRVHLRIDPGWHVNANPASLPFLVPTEVLLPDSGSPETGSEARPGDPALEVDYPEAELFQPAFVEEAIAVYSGTLEIPVTLGLDGSSGPPPERVAVRFQACDHGRCLPPARIELPVALDSAAAGGGTSTEGISASSAASPGGGSGAEGAGPPAPGAVP